MFSQSDREFLEKLGITPAYLDWQIKSFESGFPPLDLVKPATIGDGIFKYSDQEQSRFIALYETSQVDVVKFVPASGAASRMFKDLYAYLEKGTNGQAEGAIGRFFESISEFAFFPSLSRELEKRGNSIEELLEQKQYRAILEALLLDSGMGYGSLPKALLEFHAYENKTRTPIEEHFVEGAAYASTPKGVHIHFTVSPEHLERFKKLVEERKPVYEVLLKTKIFVSYSEQKKSTDTIAVDMTNQPFRNADGSLVLRPAGHGALLENLNDLQEPLVFIKNIDNVVPERLLSDTIRYKKLLAGVLLQTRDMIWNFIDRISDEGASNSLLQEVENFYNTVLCERFAPIYSTLSEEQKAAFLLSKLNRPIKVCGMVKNEGEPGGGPFWVQSKDGAQSLQIVETAQIDLKNPAQKAILAASTHFNPVDLVCWTTDKQGKKFHLPDFRDSRTGFISQKSKDGKDLKALELPGLWNGAMADWNTVFVEVPLSTFNPVKTVFDLLRKEHQPIKIHD